MPTAVDTKKAEIMKFRSRTAAGSKRAVAGWFSKKRGAMFEGTLEVAARKHGLTVVRIPDGCKQVGSVRIVRTKTPFDFVFAWNNGVCFVDAKSTSKNVFVTSVVPTQQRATLLALQANVGIMAGFVVWYTTQNVIEFYEATLVASSKRLRPGEGLYLGPANNPQIQLLKQHAALKNNTP